MKRAIFFASLALGLSYASLGGDPVTRIYLANDDHTDYLWTAGAETYNAVFVDMLDYYLRLADETKDNPPPYRSRFNADGSYWLWQYERRKSQADFDRLIARLKDGTISAPMTTLVSCYGGQPMEAVLRGLSYAGRLERRHGLRFPMAVAMENQTLPMGLASLWAGAGAKYSWRGVCACASQFPKSALERRQHDIYWYTGQDGQRVLMKWHSLAPSGNQHSGGYAEAFDPVAAVNYLDQDAAFLRHYRAPGAAEPYSVRAAFGFGWDALDRKTGQPYLAKEKDYPFTEHFHAVARSHSTARRQVIVSNEEDFFRDFETCYASQLPSESVTYGNEWDLYSASMAETSARVRRSVEKLRAAELMAVLVGSKHTDFLRNRKAARDLAFADLGLYWEHDWTADGPVPRTQRAAWQEGLASEIEAYVNPLHSDGARQLGALIQNPDAASQCFYALNPLGWPRTTPADFVYSGSTNIHVQDLTTGLDAPHQFVTLAGTAFLRVLASDVPANGYKVFAILTGPGSGPASPAAIASAGNTRIENDHIRLSLDPDGAITSLRDKSRPDFELASAIDGLKLNDFAAHQATGQTIEVENSGPVSVTLRCESNAGSQHTTRITLFRGSDHVEISNEITENFSSVRHWAFSFNLAQPHVHTEEVGAILHVKLKSEGGDYADTLARFDYVTLNHFADMTDGTNARGVTLANADCAFARLGHSTPLHLDTATAQINVLAGGQVDGSNLGIPTQNGASHFLQRFALRPHGAYDPVAAMKFSLEHQNPLVTGPIQGAGDSPYPSASYSLLTLSDPSVLLWALKPHEDGLEHGLIARMWNLSPQPTRVRLTTAEPLASAQRVTHIETPIEPLPVRDRFLETTIPAGCIQTYSLKPLARNPLP